RYCFSFFFFSSRRRHTRCYRDWSSDVCSSDLMTAHADGRSRLLRPPSALLRRRDRQCDQSERESFHVRLHWGFAATCWELSGNRSEERRVGKECRSREAPKCDDTEARMIRSRD